MSEEDELFVLFAEEDANGAEESDTAGIGAPVDAAAGSSRSAPLTSARVGAWLHEWSTGTDAALMEKEHRFLRQQILAIAKRVNAYNERQQAASHRRWFAREQERQRAGTGILPPVDTTAPLAPLANLLMSGQAQPPLGRAILSDAVPASASDAPVVAPSVAPPATVGTSPASPAASLSTSAAVVPAGPLNSVSIMDVTSYEERRTARVTSSKFHLPVKAHLRPDAPTNTQLGTLTKNKLQDLSRTVRQLRHTAAHRCYVCKIPLLSEGQVSTGAMPTSMRHATFTNHCEECGEKNNRKRDTLCDLRGRIAVLTGARIKIGYQIGIRLLRCGATLLATTRFPANALLRYKQEPDYDQWSANLHLLYADLCNPVEVRALVDRIKSMVPHVDILINNAAQTVRRPLPYMQQLNAIEASSQQRLLAEAQATDTPISVRALPQAMPDSAAALPRGSSLVALAAGDSVPATVADVAPAPSATAASASTSSTDPLSAVAAASAVPATSGSSNLAPMSRTSGLLPALNSLTLGSSGAIELPMHAHQPFSLIPALDSYTPEESARLFPSGLVDTTNDHEPLDLRAGNSWSATSAEVDTRELAEVLSVNAMAPFVLSTQLRDHMKRTPHPHRYIILVSSMEGKLNRNKVDEHVHTNMAKAALNAMTRTTAAEYARDQIYLNSVDTGWNSEERAVNDPKRDPTFETPLDCADGAARVLDPIFRGELDQNFIFGQFLKDYAPTDW